VLVYSAITNFSALQLSGEERTLWSAFSWLGLGGRLALLASLLLDRAGHRRGCEVTLTMVRRFVS
jgi:hypothetical protein